MLIPRLLCVIAATGCSAAFAEAPRFDDKSVSPKEAKAVEVALPQVPIVPVAKARRVLIYSATAGFRHGSIPIGKLALNRMGETSGAYEAVISDDPANFETDALKTFDAVLLLNSTGDLFMPTKKAREQLSKEDLAPYRAKHKRLVDNLIAYVNNGGGLVGIHAATAACYEHEAYGQTIGGYFWDHPWTAGHNVTIVVEDPEHAVIKPVFEGMDDFRIKEEIYQFKEEPYSRDALRILLNFDPERSDEPNKEPRRKDNDYAVCWVQSVGQGRVFYTSLGHRHDIYTNPLILKHYLAGIQFATGDLQADTTPSNKLQMPGLN